MTSSPWYSEIIPSGPVFSSQTLLKKSVISFRVDGTQCALHAFSDLFSMSFFLFFQLCNYTFFLSLSTSSGSEVRFDLLRTSFEMLV